MGEDATTLGVATLVLVVSLRVDLQDKFLGENDVVEKRI